MKRTTCLLLFFFVMFIYDRLPAQQISAGVKGGPTFTNLKVDDGVAENQNAVGFHIGGFLLYRISAFSYTAEIEYSLQGCKVKADGEYMRTFAQYINVPILVKYDIIPEISLQLGPQIGLLTCMKSDYNPVEKQPFDEQRYTKAYKKTDFGIVGGIGYESGKWLFDARYYYGLTDIADKPGLAETRNRVLSLSVGYKFYIRNK